MVRNWDDQIERWQRHTVPTGKREAARFRCPFGSEVAEAMRETAQSLIELANQIEHLTAAKPPGGKA
jgi:hypothetical protein